MFKSTPTKICPLFPLLDPVLFFYNFPSPRSKQTPRTYSSWKSGLGAFSIQNFTGEETIFYTCFT